MRARSERKIFEPCGGHALNSQWDANCLLASSCVLASIPLLPPSPLANFLDTHDTPLPATTTTRIVTRACGKHMAVQSDDTPVGRPCEQCAAEALNGGVKHSPPYIWNNSNYLLKMTEDLNFLTEVDPLVTWLGAGGSVGGGGDGVGSAFELKNNPFLLADLGEEGEESVAEEVRGSLPSTRRGDQYGTSGRAVVGWWWWW